MIDYENLQWFQSITVVIVKKIVQEYSSRVAAEAKQITNSCQMAKSGVEP